ncbi:hypothetical protein SPSINT_0798 [Staphylococcus pseudintermedius HKU10-03]|nr:hypothetical protein SPSINT_0798 [Staphylococcus pseudintermedius HKU10-03]ADX76957.1 hypothetical protein SPSE_1702 [Staphylococcus pseudintermedius ED99]ANS89994.1 hypothetical protein A6M57_8390 [Staphylococcus pseudintermedius]
MTGELNDVDIPRDAYSIHVFYFHCSFQLFKHIHQLKISDST